MKPKLIDQYGDSIKHDIPKPSDKFIDRSSILTAEKRKRIIDIAAKHTDKNDSDLLGRPSMCLQFSILINYMLAKEGIDSAIIYGSATYKSSTASYTWKHYWVETTSNELIDCNIDSLIYHPDSPEGIEPYNYWGDLKNIPDDRTFSNQGIFSSNDIDKLEYGDNETLIWKQVIDEEY